MSVGLELRGRRGECEALDRLISSVRAHNSQVLVLRGDAGIGKTALLDYLMSLASGCRVARAAGVESEMELAFAGLHQLCAPFMDGLDRLPEPQRDALATAFGLSAGPPPDRFLVGLAVLTLLSDVAEKQPLICLVDDAQWLDEGSTQTLAFVSRRLLAESVGLVFASRAAGDDHALHGLPELLVDGLNDTDARALLGAAWHGPLDAAMLAGLVAETRGNPLALLELPRGLTPAELAGGFGLLDAVPLGGRLEESFQRRVEALPGDSQRLLLVAAAEPVGDPHLLWRALNLLGISADAVAAAEKADLIEIGTRVRFRHPLVRSAVWRAAGDEDLREVHRTLAEATDSVLDPDRRAWHRARAATGHDEEVAAELELSAGRAQARGGMAAAAAFLDHAAMLTPEPSRRARRGLAAARAKRSAGALGAALELAFVVEAGPSDPLRTAEVERLRGEIAFDERRASDAAALLSSAARRLETLDADLARETHLEALGAAMWAGDLNGAGGMVQAAEAARAAPIGPEPPRAADVVLDALATRITDGYAAAVPTMIRALDLVDELTSGNVDVGRWAWLAGSRAGGMIALEVWDFNVWYELSKRQVQLARDAGALVQLQYALNPLAGYHLLTGELGVAALLMEEDQLIAEATRNPPLGYSAMMLAAMRGREPAGSQVIEATAKGATANGQGRLVNFADQASALLNNGLGRPDVALDAAWRVFQQDVVGYGVFVAPELAEAAARTGNVAAGAAVLEWLTERARVTPTDWALGMESRARALLSHGDDVEASYLASIEQLGRTRLRVEVARAELLYGEWLRRDRRRVDAREHLRTAHDMFATMGVEAFAERARRELLTTGETARKRTVETRDDLTAQEGQIAQLAGEGRTNPEIGAQLFISPRTVEWHLRKVFTKLGVTSRKELRLALPDAHRVAASA